MVVEALGEVGVGGRRQAGLAGGMREGEGADRGGVVRDGYLYLLVP